MGKSRSPTNFCRLEDFQVIVKRNKIQLGFDNIYFENNEDNVKHGKTLQMSDFISYAASEYCGYVKMPWRAGLQTLFKAVHEKVH